MKWETITFNVFEMGTEDRVQRAFDVLRDGGSLFSEQIVAHCESCIIALDRQYFHSNLQIKEVLLGLYKPPVTLAYLR